MTRAHGIQTDLYLDSGLVLLGAQVQTCLGTMVNVIS